ncbi:hypothetical protein ACFPM7_08665 [Actinokineospora guangxiensis]|uniref:Uncharacterized protein n=1 Tax=Actinokineospora guangxiensis TaxID=1490288 RepID=A0ABW0EM93_9PSEU
MLMLVALALVLTVLLDRNHHPRPGSRLAGSTDADDRDWARTRAELATARPLTRHRGLSARRATTARLATGPR